MSALGRWTSVDPLADEFPAWSAYNYVKNNPLSLIDPTGMAPNDWYEDQDGSYKYDSEVKSQADLGEGQTYLGEEVLVLDGDDTEYLSGDGGRGYVFDRETTSAEKQATGAAGASAAMAKQGATLDAAQGAGKALKGLKAATSAAAQGTTLLSVGLSVRSEAYESDPVGTYEVVKTGYDLTVAGGSVLGGPIAGPIVAGGGFLLEVTGGKEAIVRAATTFILERQADHIVDLE